MPRVACQIPRRAAEGTAKPAGQAPWVAGSQARPEPFQAAHGQLLMVIFSPYCQGQQGRWGSPGQGTIRCLSGPWHWTCEIVFHFEDIILKCFHEGKGRKGKKADLEEEA